MIGIIFSNDLNTCPFIEKYIDKFEHNSVEYEVILWNRDGSKREYPPNYVVYDAPMNVYIPKWKKLNGFFNFYRFLKKTLRERKYDKLVFLTTLTAVLCYGKTKKQYKGKYIFDFRDMSFEQNPVYRRMVKKIIHNSAFTCLSSPGFASVFEPCEYVMAHNFRYSDIEKAKGYDISLLPNKEKITLLHIGITRGEEYNKSLADIFGNDPRFEVFIVGSGNDTESFINYSAKYENIHVQGTYNNEEKAALIAKADLLLYYYPCSFNCNRALANKYYDCLIYKKPLIGNINTYSGRRLEQNNMGISVDLAAEGVADRIETYFRNIDLNKFHDAINTEMKHVLEEDQVYLEKIGEFIND